MKSWVNDVHITTSRLLLRPIRPADAKEVLSWINNEEIVKNFQFFTGKFSVEDELHYIEKMNNSSTDLLFGVTIKCGELIGTCGLHEVDTKNDTARLGVIIGKTEHWNKGYAEEAIRALLELAFYAMNLHKIYLNVFVTNEKSVHLYTEVGFQTEGTLRKEYKIRGEYVDMRRMSILKEEWKN